MKKQVYIPTGIIGLLALAAALLISVPSYGSNGVIRIVSSSFGTISADGRTMVFVTLNSTPSDTNQIDDVYLYDVASEALTLVSFAENGTAVGGPFEDLPVITDDGQYVAFSTIKPLVSADTNNTHDIYVYDRNTAKNVRVSVDSQGDQGTLGSYAPAISDDGRHIAFTSDAALAPNQGSFQDVFVHDRDTDRDGIFDEPGATSTVLVSVADDGTGANGASSGKIDISADGRHITFHSLANNLNSAFPSAPFSSNIYVHDRDPDGNGIFDEANQIKTTQVTLSTTGTQPDGISENPDMSSDGRYIVFESLAGNITDDAADSCETTDCLDIFMFDRDSDENGVFDESNGTEMSLVSRDELGNPLPVTSVEPIISADASTLVFRRFGDESGCRLIRRNLQSGENNCLSLSHLSEPATGVFWRPSITRDGEQVAFIASSFDLLASSPSGSYLYLFTAADVIAPTPTVSPTATKTASEPRPCSCTLEKLVTNCEFARTGDRSLNRVFNVIDTYDRMRDEVFTLSGKGNRMIIDYFAHDAELTGIIFSDATLKADTIDLVNNWQPYFDDYLDGNGSTTIPLALLSDTESVLDRINTAASPELQSAIAYHREYVGDLEQYAGMTLTESADQILDGPSNYLPKINNK